MEKNLSHVATPQNCYVTAQETMFFTHMLKSVVAQTNFGAGTLFLSFHLVLGPCTSFLSFLSIFSYPVINHLLLEGLVFKSLRLDLVPATSAKSQRFKMALMKF